MILLIYKFIYVYIIPCVSYTSHILLFRVIIIIIIIILIIIIIIIYKCKL